MALDTLEKLAAALGLGRPGVVFPFPVGSLSDTDKGILAGVYIEAAGADGEVFIGAGAIAISADASVEYEDLAPTSILSNLTITTVTHRFEAVTA